MVFLKKALCLLFFLTSVFSSCNSKRTDAESKDGIVRVTTLVGPSAMSMVKMMDDGMLNDTVSFEFIVKNEPGQVRPILLQNKTEFAILPSTMAAVLYNRGLPYILTSIPVWGTLYLFGTDTTINSWDDLKNKRVHVMARGMTPDIMFRQLLVSNGLEPGIDVQFDYSFPTHIELANAVAGGKVRLAVISEPMVSMVMTRNPAVFKIFDFDEEWAIATEGKIPFAQTALIVDRKFAENHPGLVNEFLDKYKQSIEWVNSNHAEAARLIVYHNIIPDTAIARMAIPGCHINYADAYPLKNEINEYFKVFYDFNPDITGGKLPDDAFYYRRNN